MPMKKVLLFIVSLLCIMAFAISYATAERGIAIVLELREKEIIPESKLPESVEIIEDEAFEGTALRKIKLPDSADSVGERAFADIPTLREIRISIKTSYIANNAFEGSERTTIIAPANSYARAYAKNQGIPFSTIVMFCASTQGTMASTLSINRSTEILESEDKSDSIPEHQWRRIEELNIARTEELIANHVEGRAPPKA